MRNKCNVFLKLFQLEVNVAPNPPSFDSSCPEDLKQMKQNREVLLADLMNFLVHLGGLSVVLQGWKGLSIRPIRFKEFFDAT